ncbi:Ribosomal silencing factor RsfS [Rubrivivax sp. A210]|uniref:ribosome silencing factor n=1 Tax=Rubrivivax sp. A210 TaxID=2772301 RepID=UPI00191A8E1A|nr:ribosome silencing factor [Rubrivivax sp. A210]CAD5372030.1 Ribosomal silencing factor RsfS [Rubrivivax sp. A210]
MDIRKLQRAIVDGLEDVKAQNIAVFNTEHLSSLFERVIIASGTSNRQTKALAASVRDAVRSRGMQVMSTEGEENGEWIIVDCGAAVAHIMQPGIRDYYHLEEIWGGKAVRMKVGAVNTGLVKASEPEPAPRRAAKKAVADAEAAPRKAPARKAAAKSVAKAPAKSAPKTAARKAADKTAAYQRVAGKSPARKTAAAKKAPARKTPTRKTLRTT